MRDSFSSMGCVHFFIYGIPPWTPHPHPQPSTHTPPKKPAQKTEQLSKNPPSRSWSTCGTAWVGRALSCARRWESWWRCRNSVWRQQCRPGSPPRATSHPAQTQSPPVSVESPAEEQRKTNTSCLSGPEEPVTISLSLSPTNLTPPTPSLSHP